MEKREMMKNISWIMTILLVGLVGFQMGLSLPRNQDSDHDGISNSYDPDDENDGHPDGYMKYDARLP